MTDIDEEKQKLKDELYDDETEELKFDATAQLLHPRYQVSLIKRVSKLFDFVKDIKQIGINLKSTDNQIIDTISGMKWTDDQILNAIQNLDERVSDLEGE